MSGRLEIWRDAAIGETREMLMRDGKPVAIDILRASDEGARARWGEIYVARVREIDQRRRGAFLDLGLREAQGFLPLGADGNARIGRERVALTQGMSVRVEVVREAARGKSAVLTLRELGHDGKPPQRIARPECDETLAQARPAEAVMRANIDAALEDALAERAAIAGGGALAIEPTAALAAIDVDAGGRQGSGDPERFALDLNLAAAVEAALQVRLRNLGGLIAIDFVSMRSKAHQARLEEAVRAAFADDPWSVQFGGLSRFGVYELSRAQLRMPLHERLCDEKRRLSAETLALMALRAIEREASADRGAQIVCTVTPEVKAWLDSATLAWPDRLSAHIGMRWRVETGGGPRERIDARAL
jgi:ribonuclease E